MDVGRRRQTGRVQFTGLWRHPDFLRFWAGQTISLAGDQVSALAFPLVAIGTLHASPAQMGLLATAGGAPLLLVGLFAGVWADRTRRRPLLIGANLGRAAILGSIPLAAALDLLSMPYLYIVAFLTGVLGVGFNAAYGAFLPTLVARDQLVEGNSKLTMTRSVTQIAGPGLAGVIVQLLTAPAAIVLDATSFIVSAFCLGLIRTPESGAPPRAGRRNVWREISEGLRLVARQPLLRASAGSAGTYNFFNAVLSPLALLYLSRSLALSPTSIGFILAAVGPGSLVGALLAVRTASSLGLGPAMIGGLALAGGANLAFPLVSGSPLIIVIVLVAARFLNGLGQPLYNINQVSLRQVVTPDGLQGRMNATMQFLTSSSTPLGALLGGLLGELLGVRAALVIGAIGTLLACLWPLCSPVRRLHDLPAPAEPLSIPPSGREARQVMLHKRTGDATKHTPPEVH